MIKQNNQRQGHLFVYYSLHDIVVFVSARRVAGIDNGYNALKIAEGEIGSYVLSLLDDSL